MNDELSKKLHTLRKEKKLTQSDVAKVLGVTTRQYAYQENGHFALSPEKIIKLCELYQISSNELFGITEVLVYPKIED